MSEGSSEALSPQTIRVTIHLQIAAFKTKQICPRANPRNDTYMSTADACESLQRPSKNTMSSSTAPRYDQLPMVVLEQCRKTLQQVTNTNGRIFRIITRKVRALVIDEHEIPQTVSIDLATLAPGTPNTNHEHYHEQF